MPGPTVARGIHALHAKAKNALAAAKKAHAALKKATKKKPIKPVEGQVYYLIPGKPLHVKQPTSGVDFRAVVFKGGQYSFVVPRNSSIAEKEALAALNSSSKK